MAVHDGHRERLRQRFMQQGLWGFAPHEALELVLTYAIPRRDTNALAHALIDRFGSFSAVLDARAEELVQVPGIGENAAVLLSMLPQLLSMYHRDRWGERPNLSSSRTAGAYCTALFAEQREESMMLLCLDTHKGLISVDLLSKGSVDAVPADVRAVVECALRHKAHSVLLTHNHPGGDPTPSRDDVQLTYRFSEALRLMEMELVDHIIVAGEKFASLNQMGLLSPRFGAAQAAAESADPSILRREERK